MKACSLNVFLEELKPWLDRDHIRNIERGDKARLIVHFLDGTKHVYSIDDCNAAQVEAALADLKKKGIAIE
ncbi:MAG: hypothetical protein AB1568_13555 [Thermodesulfobacteriota bacterium]